jgi:hypothetical protein
MQILLLRRIIPLSASEKQNIDFDILMLCFSEAYVFSNIPSYESHTRIGFLKSPSLASEKRNTNSCKAAKRNPASEMRNTTSQNIIFIQKTQKDIHL